MSCYSLTHLADHVLLRELAVLNTQDRATTVALLAHLAEVEQRRLYLPKAYASMYAYCIHELRMSEDIALKRLRAARAARRFPAIYAGLADGRLHLSGVALLARFLEKDNWKDLLTAAVHKTKAEIELLLAQRFPQADVPTMVQALAASTTIAPVAASPQLPIPGPAEVLPVPGPVNTLALQAEGPIDAARTRVAPLAPGRFALQVTVSQKAHDHLRYAQALLGHAVPSGDVATVIERALVELVESLERRKFAKCARSRPRRGSVKGRYVPAEVRRAVFQRDAGRCTFTSDSGKRCEARSRLEFDHVDAVAKGGQATTANLRLRCRAHNQYAAECAFGAGFMHEKRQGARRRADEAKAQARAEAAAMDARQRAAAKAAVQPRPEPAPKPARDLEVIPWLRQLGFSATDAKRGAEFCAHLGDAPLEQRVRTALRGLAPNCVRVAAPAASSPA